MAIIAGLIRAATIGKLPTVIKSGISATAYYNKMRSIGRFYRKTTFLADWRAAAGIEKALDVIKYVRKGYVPTGLIAEAEAWKLSKEYMYKMQVEVRLRPGEPIEKRFRNIMTDTPITIEAAEARIEEMWAETPEKVREEIIGIIPVAVVRKVT